MTSGLSATEREHQNARRRRAWDKQSSNYDKQSAGSRDTSSARSTVPGHAGTHKETWPLDQVPAHEFTVESSERFKWGIAERVLATKPDS